MTEMACFLKFPVIFSGHSKLLTGKTVYVVGDADKAGELGALKWCTTLVGKAALVKKITLPYEVVEKHGKDLRDWLREPGNDYRGLLAMAAAAPATISSETLPAREGPSAPALPAPAISARYL
jgi:hypothetical protein